MPDGPGKDKRFRGEMHLYAGEIPQPQATPRSA